MRSSEIVGVQVVDESVHCWACEEYDVEKTLEQCLK